MFVELIYTLNTLLASLPLLQMIVPILADVFVFVYPVYLLWLYFVSSSIQHKIAAASIVTSAILGVAVNYTLKFWLPSPRPFTVLDLEVNPHDALVLRDLPEMTFPSDHAMMGAVIATSILIRAYRTQDTKSIYIGRLCVCFALIMDVCRIAIGVHRPMDIVAGTIVGCVVAYLCTHPAIVRLLQIYIYDWCISLEEKVMKLLQS